MLLQQWLYDVFHECSLSGEVIINLPLPSDKSSYGSNLLRPVFQSINRLSQREIKVWMEIYACLQSDGKIKELCQVCPQRVSGRLWQKWARVPKTEWEKPVALPVLWGKNYTCFQNLEKLRARLPIFVLSWQHFVAAVCIPHLLLGVPMVSCCSSLPKFPIQQRVRNDVGRKCTNEMH